MRVTSAVRSGVQGATRSSTSSKPVVCRSTRTRSTAAGGEQFVQEGQVEEDVGVGPDEDVVGGGPGRLGAAGVDHDDPPAPRLDLPEPLGGVGHLEEAPLRHHRVRAHDDEALGAVHVGERLGEREAVDLAGRGELVGAVLGGRGVHRRGAEAVHEPLGEHRVQHAEAGRGAHVHGHACRARGRPRRRLTVAPISPWARPQVTRSQRSPTRRSGYRRRSGEA